MPTVKRIGKYGVYDEYSMLDRKMKCPQCKRVFSASVNAHEWGYAIRVGTRTKMLCSYTCMKKFEEPILEKKRKRIAKEFRLAGNFEMEDAILANAI